MNAVDNNLSATAGDLYNSKLHAQLWAAINDEINLTECDIYRYLPSLFWFKSNRIIHNLFRVYGMIRNTDIFIVDEFIAAVIIRT